MVQEYEYKAAEGGVISDVDTKQGIVTGWLSVFDNKDLGGDIIPKGAFTKTIAERGPQGNGAIRFLQDHDQYKNVGKFQVLEEKDYGLYYEGKPSKSTKGRDFLILVEEKIITHNSIGYKAINASKSADGSRVLREIYLVEGSGLQVDPMNPLASMIGVKSLQEVETLLTKLYHTVKHGTLSDECYIQTILPKIEEIKLLKAAITEPPKSTLPSNRMSEIESIINNQFNIN